MAAMFSGSVARGFDSTGSSPMATASSRNAAIHWSVYDRRSMPAFCAPMIVLSSTSVKFITWWTV